MNTITKLITAGLCGLALSACGGDGGDDEDNVIPQGAIAACFTVPTAVSFLVVSDNNGYHMGALPPDYVPPKQNVGPSTFNGRAATESTAFGDTGEITSRVYWAVTNSGVALLGQRLSDGTTYVANPAPLIPLDMQPGQSMSIAFPEFFSTDFDAPANLTFMGLETLTLSGKTFSNVCHFQLQGTPANATDEEINDFWYAPGYGKIKSEYPWAPAGATIWFEYFRDL